MSNQSEKEVMRNVKNLWALRCSKGELYCFLCGKIIESMKNCNADHWVPRALGGETTEENLKPAHISCNLKKSCASPEFFLEHKEEILSGKCKVVEPYKIRGKSFERKKRESKNKKQYMYTIGSSIYYIKESLDSIPCDFEIKEGVIIGFTYENNIEYALIKDFYTNQENKIESQLIEVLPLSKEQAYKAKNNYEKQINNILKTRQR